MGRKPKSDLAPGIFKRKGSSNYWLRYTVGGKQIRTSLETTDPKEALVIAERIKAGAKASEAASWEIAVDKYISKKLRDEDFTEKTADTVKFALQCFQNHTGATSPSDLTTKSLQSFYEHLRKQKYAEATSQGYIVKIASFARFCGLLVERPRFKGDPLGVKNVVTASDLEDLIDGAPTETLKAVLLLGFCCGLRKDEIVNVKPHWIDLKSQRLLIPGKEGGWKTKSGRSRAVPLPTKVKEFLETALEGWEKEKYLIAPKARGKRYRYDFRRPFEEYMEAKGFGWVSPHIMRHSYATMLAESGVSPVLIASWTGDRIKTIERHYLHTQAAQFDVVDEALSGITQVDKISNETSAKVAARLGVQEVNLDDLSEEERDAIFNAIPDSD